jgi:hypothetical protein
MFFGLTQPNTVFMYVRFAPESGHKADLSRCPLCANNDLMRRSKKPRLRLFWEATPGATLHQVILTFRARSS